MRSVIENGNKIHFISLGCARNLVDSEVMLGILLKAGYEVTQNLGDADFLIVNTCGFLASAREEACLTIEKALENRKATAKLIVAGCMVQKHKGELQEKFPGIHYYLGSGDVERILDAVASATPGEAVTSARSYLEWGEIPRQRSTPNHYAYLKIAEGCAKQCAFCIIPKIKGPLKSKSQDQVLKEFKLLLNQGVKEVILIAQDLGDFGKDRREKGALENLLRAMIQEKGDFWIRLLYLYPDEITDELIALMQSDSRICSYLDMPLQHINDDILKAMRRRTNKAHILKTLVTLREKVPGVVIRTSLMVGFPGETEAQFEELCHFVKKASLDNVGIFKYSKEEESFSAKMAGHLSDEIKEQRFQKLAKIQLEVQAKNNKKKYLGKTLKVLIEGYHPDSFYLMKGRFYGQCPEIDGQVIINDCQHVDTFGEFYEVKITQILGYDLVGTVLARKKAPPKLSLIS